MKQNIVIMDFSGIYREEQFHEEEKVSWIDLKDISGTNCYCDGEAQAQLLERMEKYPASGIYFIDSGNYHYMSRIGAGRVKETFNLLVFDNHTDMQLPAFGELLSCGGWIASALEEVENLREVWLVGPDEEAYGQVEERFKGRVHFLSRERLAEVRKRRYDGECSCEENRENSGAEKMLLPGGVDKTIPENQVWGNSWISKIPTNTPLYVSIDKDVLCPEAAATTWSQGDMTLGEMLEILGLLKTHFSENGGRILQVDICGECDPDESMENHKNDRANKELLNFWKAMVWGDG